jgi:hypothetical protein
MTCRKWLVRGLVFTALGGLALGALLFQYWTNPVAVRQAVLDKLAGQFLGATVSLESARLRLLGGIAVQEIRMTRRDDLDKADFLYVPSGVIYHDKEQLFDGRLAIRKVELHRPRLRIVRERDGSWNLDQILGPIDPTTPGPTLVVQQGNVLLEDRAASPGLPVLEIRDLNLTLTNDPLEIITIEGTGQTDVAGPIRIRARFRRDTKDFIARVELTMIPVGPALVQRLVGYAPELVPHLRQFKATATLQIDFAYHPASAQAFAYDLTCSLTGGELSHARLPAPLEQLEASLRCINGQVPHAHLKGLCRTTTIDLTLKDAVVPERPPDDPLELVRELDLRLEHLPVSRDLFDRLPESMQDLWDDYHPVGMVSVEHRYYRESPGAWRRHCVIRGEDVAGWFKEFAYPVEHVKGTIEWDAASNKGSRIRLDLSGEAQGRPFTVTGLVEGEKGTSAVAVDVRGNNLPLDDKLWAALQPKHRALALQFHPTGLADFEVTVRRQQGCTKCANRFLVKVHDATLRYDLFPYPLEDVTGTLDIQPNHWECRDFHGRHKGGEFLVDGRSFPLSGEGDERKDKVQMTIQGRNILLDEEFTEALAPPSAPNRAPLQKAWRTLAIAGRMGFVAKIDDLPNQPQDVDVTVKVQGCTIRPKFFPYPMDQVSGLVRYARDRVYLWDVSARHGGGQLTLKGGEIILTPGGGFQARLALNQDGTMRPALRGTNLTPDAALLTALPEGLRKGIEPLEMRQPFDVTAALIVTVPAEPNEAPEVWWNGSVDLREATLRAGVELTGVTGQVWTCGQHNGRNLQGVVGTVLFDRATVLDQPLRQVVLHGEVRPDSPDVVRIRDLSAKLFGGDVSGEALIDFGPKLRYDLTLHALQIQLQQFGRHNQLGPEAELKGPASASLHLTGEGTELNGLKGNGRIDVKGAKMYRLPLLLDLLKAFSLRLPDRTMFEEVHAAFGIEGQQVRMQKLELLGNAVSLRGEGTLNLDGTEVNLDFHADPGRVNQMLPGGINVIPKTISNQLLKVKVRGRLGGGGKLRYESELVPGVLDPLKKVLGSGRPDS